MFKLRILVSVLVPILLASLFGTVPLLAQTSADAQARSATMIPAELPDGVIAYASPDGGRTIIPIKEQAGVAERLSAGMSRAEFMAQHQTPPESEAAIVHDTPLCPVVINGIRYRPEDIHLFDGHRLGFTVGKDGVLYAFTSDEALGKFEQEQGVSMAGSTVFDTLSYFYEHINGGGSWVAGPPGTEIPNLSQLPVNLDNKISSEYINSAATSATLFDDYDYRGDYLDIPGNTYVPDLRSYGWNDKASSLIVWWF